MKKASTKKPLKALPRPVWKPQAIIFAVITNKKFDMIIMAFIGLNMVNILNWLPSLKLFHYSIFSLISAKHDVWPLWPDPNVEHDSGQCQLILHCGFHIRNVSQDIRPEKALFSWALELVWFHCCPPVFGKSVSQRPNRKVFRVANIVTNCKYLNSRPMKMIKSRILVTIRFALQKLDESCVSLKVQKESGHFCSHLWWRFQPWYK